MGLVSFWANIAGPRVQEISPQGETPWLERGRSNTAGGGRFGLRRPGSTGQEPDKPATNTKGEKKTRRMVRSLSRPRRSAPIDVDSQRAGIMQHSSSDTQVPEVPPLPRTLSQSNSQQKDQSVPEEQPRPATAATPQGLQASEIFELPAEPLPSDDFDRNVNRLMRTRSGSPASEGKPARMSHWFRLNTNKDKALPPPPPPTCPLPPIPDDAPVNQLPQTFYTQRPDLRRSRSTSSRLGRRPQIARSSSENDFSATMPALVHDYERTPSDSEVSSVSSPKREKNTFAKREKQIPMPIKTTTTLGHKCKDSGIGTPNTPYTPSGIMRWTRAAHEDEADDLALTGWSESDIREWDEASRAIEVADMHGTHGGAVMMKSLATNCVMPRTGHTNEQALAELRFGV